VSQVVGAKTGHGCLRPAYWTNPETSRDPPTQIEVRRLEGGHSVVVKKYWAGGKIWRKAREGKL
jgi:hypothetical protein